MHTISISSAYPEALAQANHSIEQLLAELELESSLESDTRLARDGSGGLQKFLLGVAGVLKATNSFDLRSYWDSAEARKYGSNLEALKEGIEKIDCALQAQLAGISANLAASRAAQSWSETLRNLSE